MHTYIDEPKDEDIEEYMNTHPYIVEINYKAPQIVDAGVTWEETPYQAMTDLRKITNLINEASDYNKELINKMRAILHNDCGLNGSIVKIMNSLYIFSDENSAILFKILIAD